MLGNCHLTFILVDATHFLLGSCYVLDIMLYRIATRKFIGFSVLFLSKIDPNNCLIKLQKKFSFDGTNFIAEPSSKFPHFYVLALGSYRNSPFVTGHYSNDNGLKTEILDYEAAKWHQEADYPFSYGNRYVASVHG